jgi:MFS transporter, DHA2 family, multidrug resistance protein
VSERGAAPAWSPERSAAGKRNPWLIAGLLSIATFMEVLDTSIANVALRHIAGSLAASIDESTWVLTSYLVANAIILPVSGWLSGVVGRKRFYMISVALFTMSSLMCGLSPNLACLITARVFQGLGGGGLAPSEQSMLADTFPPAKRAQAFAMYGVAVIVAPALGPTIGGYITDNASWHWIFFLNVPFGIVSLILVHFFVDEPEVLQRERQKQLQAGLKVDWIGFALVALFLGALEIVLDKGQEDDWFTSSFIVTFAVISALSFLAFVPWELTRRDPIVDIRLIGQRQFGTSWLVMLSVGMILFSSTQFMPQLLQENYGYTATLAGLALMPGGFAALLMMIVAGKASAFVQPKYLMASAMLAIGLAMIHFTSLTPNASFAWFAIARVLQMAALPVLFLTITSFSYVGLPPEKSSQASALINVARNLGGSIGVSMAQTLLARREQFHQSRLAEHIFPSSVPYQQTLQQAANYFAAHGASSADAQNRAIGWIGQTIANQTAYLSYIDVFAALGILAFVLTPAGLLLTHMDLGRRPSGH